MTWLRKLGPLLGLAVMCGVLSAVSPDFRTTDNAINILRQSAVNSLLALGQLMVILTAGIDLSVGSLLGLCCVFFALLLKYGFAFPVAMAATLLLGLLLGYANGLLLTRLKLPHPFVSTLGMMNAARGAALIISGGFPISGLPDSARWMGAGTVGPIPAPVLVMALMYAVFHFTMRKTLFGRDVYAIGGNAEASRLAGIPVERRLNTVYALSGGLAALAAIVVAGRMNSGFPLAGQGAELDSIAAVIIGGGSFFGGVGTVVGTLIGALIMAVLRNGLNLLNVSAHWQLVVVGLVIIIAVWIDVLRQRQWKKRAAPQAAAAGAGK
jgi:ribose transport system permease protein